jgi:hypothetical protein
MKAIRVERPGGRESLIYSGALEPTPLPIQIDREIPLKDAAKAHRALEGRETTGKILLKT